MKKKEENTLPHIISSSYSQKDDDQEAGQVRLQTLNEFDIQNSDENDNSMYEQESSRVNESQRDQLIEIDHTNVENADNIVQQNNDESAVQSVRNNTQEEEEDEYEQEYGDSSGEEDQKSQVVSQQPLSSRGDHYSKDQDNSDEDIEIIENEDERVLMKKPRNKMDKRDMLKIGIYQIGFLVVSIATPIAMSLNDGKLGTNCKTSPHYASHIIFFVLQLGLLILSIVLHKKAKSNEIKQYQPQDVSSSQGRCCREILSHIKLIDTYTNLCFLSILLALSTQTPSYFLIVTLISLGAYILLKLSLIFQFLFKIVAKLSENQEETQRSLVKQMIWLDLEQVSRLYDDQQTIDGKQSSVKEIGVHKMRYGFVKILIEDIPIMVMQSLYLHLDQCKEGLSTLIILSLYFNGICILYAFSNIFTLTGNSQNQSKTYQKELERLKDFYDQSNNQIRVVAEFYIEDNLELQATKLQALIDYISDNGNDVSSFNLSTNQMGPQTLSKLSQILVNCYDSLMELTLSRCRLGSVHVSSLFYDSENHLLITPSLAKLNLQENRISDKGAAVIARYIRENNRENLLGINLEQNLIRLQGATELVLAIKESQSVFQINLKRNKVPPINSPRKDENNIVSLIIFETLRATQINYIRYALKKGGTNSYTQNRSRPLEQYNVRISPNNEGFDRVLQQMFRVDPYQPTVKTLDLSMRFFKGARNLHREPNNPIRNVLTSQKYINLQQSLLENQPISKQYFDYFKSFKTYDDEQRLILVALHYNTHLKSILKSISPDLSNLSIPKKPSQFEQVISESPAQLMYLGNSVQTINLSSGWFPNNPGSQKSAQTVIYETISSFESLQEIIYNNNTIKKPHQFFEALTRSATQVLTLKIKSCTLLHSAAQIANVAKQFGGCFITMKALRALNLSYSNLNDDLVNGLADSISEMTHLQKINLKQCGLSHISVDKILEKLTQQVIPKKQGSLVSLNLSGNNLQGLSNMGKFLAKSQFAGSLEILKLSNCKLSDPELKQLSHGLKINKTLRVIDLSQNHIKNNLGPIMEGLICNIGLEKLDLSSNLIEDEGLCSLIEGALVGNKGLETFAIGFNKYGLEGLQCILNLFQVSLAEEGQNQEDMKKTSITNLSFSIPNLGTNSAYQALCNLILKTLARPAIASETPKQEPLIDPLSSDDSEEDDDQESESQYSQDLASSQRIRRKQQKLIVQKAVPNNEIDSEDEDLESMQKYYHRYKRLEILGDNLERLNHPQDFFFRFFKDCCANVDEIIIDGILQKTQIHDMVRGLYNLIQPEAVGTDNKQQQQSHAHSKQDLRRIASHHLQRVTFIKPQEFSEEIQMLETILDQKLGLGNTFIQHVNNKKLAKARKQHALNIKEQQANSNKIDSRFNQMHESFKAHKQEDEIELSPNQEETQGEGNLPSQMLTESLENNELAGQSFIGTTTDNRLFNESQLVSQRPMANGEAKKGISFGRAIKDEV